MAILKRMNYGAVAEGTGVKMVIGNATIVMGYEEALNLATQLRVAGKQAKSVAGDMSRNWRSIATLSAAETGNIKS